LQILSHTLTCNRTINAPKTNAAYNNSHILGKAHTHSYIILTKPSDIVRTKHAEQVPPVNS